MAKPGPMPEAPLTPEMVQSMKTRAGTMLRIEHSVFNDRASPLAVKKFTAGIGDDNPLWLDDQYAKTSPYRTPIAPPSFVIGCFSGVQFGWPGLGSFHSSSQLWFDIPVCWEDHVDASCRYEGFDGPKPSSFAGETVVDKFTNVYKNQFGATIARIAWQVFNFERNTARKRVVHRDLSVPHRWTDEELADLELRVLGEHPRGSTTRTWEETSVGDALGSLTKGPIGLTDEIAFVAGGGAPIPRLSANAVALRAYAKHPSWAFRDNLTGAKEPIYSVHYNERAAHAMGVPYQYDVGFQRQCWQIQHLTNWAGDEGWVKYAEAQYRQFVFLGDAVTLTGRVLKKRIDDSGEHVVDIETQAVNQRGYNVMPGRAVIALPTKSGLESPAATRAQARIAGGDGKVAPQGQNRLRGGGLT